MEIKSTILMAIFALVSCGRHSPITDEKMALSQIMNGELIEIMSIDWKTVNYKHGDAYLLNYKIHDRAVVANKTDLLQIAKGLQLSFDREPTDGKVGCFYPRHGIRVNNCTLLICFQCELLAIIIFENDEWVYSGDVRIDQDGRDIIDQMWLKYGIDPTPN